MSSIARPADRPTPVTGLLLLLSLMGCERLSPNDAALAPETAATNHGPVDDSRGGKTGVLLVSHGSHSPEWRRMLSELGDAVTPDLLAIDGVGGVKSAFMEYTEPSIATQLERFDREGCDRVVLIPLLLTVSSHSFDDIPTIIGAKQDARTLLTLKSEGIEVYQPQAEVQITPLLDFSELLLENLPRRIAELSQAPADEGVVLVAYGSVPFNQEWESFFSRIGQAVQEAAGVAEVTHSWCGHIVEYSGEPTKQAVRDVLSRRERAIVIPVLVARDENFQDKIIGGALDELEQRDRVRYAGDAILPDASLNAWVVSIAEQSVAGGQQAGEQP